MTDDEELVPVFVPQLSVVLITAEDKKQRPLTNDEVIELRDNAACIMMAREDAQKMDERRGVDIDPENCWYDWQIIRRELGRKPDLDPGPKFDFFRSSDPQYQETIRKAQETIEQFRGFLPNDGAPRFEASIKTRLTEDDKSALMWMNWTSKVGDSFEAELFEVPEFLSTFQVGDRISVSLESLADWMVNIDGELHGGFSLRYHRTNLSPAEQVDFDRHIGVTKYA